MKSKLTILTIAVALLLGTQGQAQQDDSSDDSLLVAAGAASDDTRYSSFIDDVDLTSAVAEDDCQLCGGDYGGCDDCMCSDCVQVNLLGRTFASAEFMHWYSKDRFLPPLVTTSPQGTAAAEAGVLGFPNTEILFGGEKVGGDRQSGGRAMIGMWLDDCGERAVGFRGFASEGRSIFYSAESTGNPILARPFYNDDPLVNAQDSLIVALAGVAQYGRIDIQNDHDVYGGQIFGRRLLDCGCNYRLDLIGGYRYDRIDDGLLISTFVDTAANTFTYLDLFDVKNEYNAGELGLMAEVYRGCWTFGFLGKVGLGNMKQEVLINGQHVITGGGAATGTGGLLTQPTNINIYERDLLVWAPEANFKLTYNVNDQLSVGVGYSFMYWTRVAFAGDQVDTRVNATQLNGGSPLVGPATPGFTWRDTDYWVQTVDIGGSFNY